MRIKVFTILLINVLAMTSIFAGYGQQSFYRMELGAFGGVGAETSKTMYKELRPAFGGIVRFKFDKRWSLRLTGGGYNLYSAVNDGVAQQSLQYTNTLIVSDLVGEFNFFDFEINEFNRKARRFSPYIFAGIGGTMYRFESQSDIEPLVAFGVGIKYKLAPRWNLNAQYVHHLSFTDRLEGVCELSDIYGVKGSNFLNKDMLSAITVGITFDFWLDAGHCYCK
ncbi:MAG: porin family protein [Prevotellaceae bacterium]|nr:porin family protein [Prevotellaceae bacterium]